MARDSILEMVADLIARVPAPAEIQAKIETLTEEINFLNKLLGFSRCLEKMHAGKMEKPDAIDLGMYR